MLKPLFFNVMEQSINSKVELSYLLRHRVLLSYRIFPYELLSFDKKV